MDSSLFKASVWWSLSTTLCITLWAIMLVLLTEEPYKPNFLDKILLFFMATQITAIIVYRLIQSFERSSCARQKWVLISSRINFFAHTIKRTSPEIGTGLPPSTREEFLPCLEELSFAFGLYHNPDSLVPECDNDGEDALVHDAPDQFVDEDLPSKSPNTIFERIVSSLRSVSFDLYYKLGGSKPKPAKSWLPIFLDLDRMVDEAAQNEVINDTTRARLRSMLDDIAEYYHAILDFHPFDCGISLWCTTVMYLATWPYALLDSGVSQTIISTILVSAYFLTPLVIAEINDNNVNKSVNHPKDFFNYFSHHATLNVVYPNRISIREARALRTIQLVPPQRLPGPPRTPTNETTVEEV
ncbi:hypothetical protein ONZ45_g5059 [Pleurotus djamor]|nr:hypothetical protein ONZ45_g5059 [Pleurotus djamor]